MACVSYVSDSMATLAIKQLGDAINSEVFFSHVKYKLNGLNSTHVNKFSLFSLDHRLPVRYGCLNIALDVPLKLNFLQCSPV